MAPYASQRRHSQGCELRQQDGVFNTSHSELLALQVNITAALKKLAVDEGNRQAMAGGIPLLLQQLCQHGCGPATQALQVQAAAALGMLATDSSNRRAIADAGGVPKLVQLLSSSSEEAQETAAAVVWALAFEQECREAVVAAGGVPSLIHLCATSGSSAVLEHAAGALWNLTYDEATRTAVAAAGGIAPLVSLLHSSSVEVQQHAAGALANLAVDSPNSATIAGTAGTTLLVQLLGSRSIQVVEFAIDMMQDCLTAAAALDVTAVQAAVAGFSKDLAAAGGLAALAQLLPATADAGTSAGLLTVRQSAAACLASLATDPVYAQALAELDSGIQAVVDLAGSASLEEQDMAATILGLVAAVDDKCRRAVCQANGVAALVALLDSSSHAVVANAAAAVSNLAAEADCRKALAAAGGIQKLLNLLSQAASAVRCTASIAPPEAAIDLADRPRLSLMSGALSAAESMMSQPDSWLCPMSSVAPLVNSAAGVAHA